MPHWTPIHPPRFEGPLSVRLACERESRTAGVRRVCLTAFDGEREVYTQFYHLDVWEGHCGGLLLIDAFVHVAEARAWYFRMTPEEQGFFSYMSGMKYAEIPRYNPYIYSDPRHVQWASGEQRAMRAVTNQEDS